MRELREELDCDIAVGDRVETTTHRYEFGVIRLTTFFTILDSGEPRATEHSALRWIPVTELRSVEWAPADLPAVEHVLRVMLS